jgi:hypothetical protein
MARLLLKSLEIKKEKMFFENLKKKTLVPMDKEGDLLNEEGLKFVNIQEIYQEESIEEIKVSKDIPVKTAYKKPIVKKKEMGEFEKFILNRMERLELEEVDAVDESVTDPQVDIYTANNHSENTKREKKEKKVCFSETVDQVILERNNSTDSDSSSNSSNSSNNHTKMKTSNLNWIPVKELIVENENLSDEIVDSSDLEDFYFGKEIALAYVKQRAFLDKQEEGRGETLMTDLTVLNSIKEYTVRLFEWLGS